MMSAPGRSRAVFLDRDGTLIRDRDYLADPDGVELISGVPEALETIGALGLLRIIVTNQSGIGRGLFSESDYHAVDRRVHEELRRAGVEVEGTYFCPDAPSEGERSDCRKPNVGMHRAAEKDLDVQLDGSYYVGDKESDLIPAQRLGGVAILVRTGYGREAEAELSPEIHVVDDVLAAARLIAGLESSPDSR